MKDISVASDIITVFESHKLLDRKKLTKQAKSN